MVNNQTESNTSEGEQPPLLSSWNRLYSLVLLNLAVLIVLFYIFTRVFQ